MKIQIILAAIIIVAIISCDNTSEPDYSGIADPSTRWQAYGIKNYSLEQARICFCVNRGVNAKVFIIDNKIVNVLDIAKGTSLPQNEWQWYKTIDQLFATISAINKDSVASFHVDYDLKYGFPTSFFVDPNSHIADEEYGYDSKNFNRF
jgi:hypothetical protein